MAERMTRTERLVLLIAILASFVSFLDSTVVSVALPAISADLGGGLATQQWVVDAYLITLAALILVAGSLSDVFGRIVMLRVGLIGFGLTSIAIAAAPDPVFLVVARGAQGVAGALLVPSSLALITSTFRDAARAKAIGQWTAATTVAMVIGPLFGGLFIDLLSWRFVFLINVLPIAVTLWLLARLGMKDQRMPHATVDVWGAALCTAGLGGVVFALIEQQNLGWRSPAIWAPFALGALAFAGFLVRQRTAAHPMMPLDLFRARNFWTGNVATFFIYAALALPLLVITVYLQQGEGWPATLAGLVSLPSTVLMIVLSPRIGALSGRWGPRVFMTVGPLVMAAGALLFLTMTAPVSYWWQVLPGIVVFGTGLSLTVAPLTAAILGAVAPERSGIGSAVNNAVARIAGLLATAMLGIIAGGTLDIEGLHRTMVVTAALMAIGGLASFLGIRTPRQQPVPPA